MTQEQFLETLRREVAALEARLADARDDGDQDRQSHTAG